MVLGRQQRGDRPFSVIPTKPRIQFQLLLFFTHLIDPPVFTLIFTGNNPSHIKAFSPIATSCFWLNCLPLIALSLFFSLEQVVPFLK
jgi:hypothetical protein